MRFPRRSRIDSLLEEFCAGELDAAAAAEVERRIRDEPLVRARYEEILDAREALRALRERPAPAPDETVFARIRASIQADRFAKRPHLPLEAQGARFYRGLALAATLLFAVTASFLATRGEGAGPAPITGTTRPPVAGGLALDPMPSPATTIEAIIARAQRGEISGAEYKQLLADLGLAPDDAVYSPMMVPISAESQSWR